MKEILKKLSVFGLAFAISFSAFGVMPTQLSELSEVQAASLKLSDKKLTLAANWDYTLNLGKVAGKKCVWKSSNKKVATVNKKGVVKTKKKGKAVISCTYKKKTYKCTITVVDAIGLSDFDFDTTAADCPKDYTNLVDWFDKNAISGGITEIGDWGAHIDSNMRGLSIGDSYKDFQKKYGLEDYYMSKNTDSDNFIYFTSISDLTFAADTNYICECNSVITYNGTNYFAMKLFYFNSNDELIGCINKICFNN